MKSDSIFASGLSRQQRWNRVKNKVLHIRPFVIIDNNPISICGYVADMDAKYGPGWL